MIWKYDTMKINGERYLTGFRLAREFGRADYILEDDEPFNANVFDQYFKYRWRVEKNPDYDSSADINKENRPFVFVSDPIKRTAEEVAVAELVKKREGIQLVDVLRALVDHKNGDDTKLNQLEKLL